MSTLEKIFYALVALFFLRRWFRIVLPVAVGMLVGWLIGELTPLHSDWVTYALMLVGLLLGATWHNQSQSRFGRDAPP